MENKSKFYKRVLIKMLTRPLVLWPAVAGTTAIMAGWAADRPGLLFGGLIGVLAGGGSFFSRLFLGGKKEGRMVAEQMHREAKRKTEQTLDRLEQELSEDGDPRTESALRDLRALSEKFKDDALWSADINAFSRYEITSGVDQIFHASVGYLSKSLDLWRTAHDLSTEAARVTLLDRREKLIADVQDSLGHISKILGETQVLAVEDSADANLGAIRLDLDEKLRIAKKVELEMGAWDADRAPAQIPVAGDSVQVGEGAGG